METYKSQDKKLALDVLDRYYFSEFKQGKKNLELFLFGQCSANCEYCYLKKYQENLYPNNISNKEIILQNLDILLKWYIKNQFKCSLSLFSAEWLDNNEIREKVFSILYNNFFQSEYFPKQIIIPTNGHFILNDLQINSILNWYDKFKNINISLAFSISIDGKYCDEGRILYDDNFYKKLFDFAKKTNALFHPMVSSSNVKNWIQNYEWWEKQNQANNLMMLEVRDESWTSESISDLLKFLNFEIDYKFKHTFNSNKKLFLQYVLNIPNNNYNIPSYNNLNILSSPTEKSFINCTVTSKTLPIRVGDLSIAMCHRLYYDELIVGNFIVENNEIIDFNEKNVSLLIARSYLNQQFLPHCDSCRFRKSCVGFCLGNSYENYKNMFVPTMEVCEMYSAKISFLFIKYAQMGLFDELYQIKSQISDENIKYLTDILADLTRGIKNE